MAGAWSVEQVAQWCDQQPRLGSEVAQRVRDEEVDGAALLIFATDRGWKDLKEALGLSVGKAMALWKGVKELAGGSEEEEGVPPQTAPSSLHLEPARVPPPAERLTGREPRGSSTLRTELGMMRISALRKRAEHDGADEQTIEDAEDSDDAKAALIELIVELEDGDSRLVDLWAELAGMKKSALRKRAHALGVDEQTLEDAEDSDDAKAALTELILALQQPGAHAGHLRAELEAMKKSALRKRALSEQLDEAAVEEAEDSDDAKAALVELILRSTAAASRPSAGGKQSQASLRQKKREAQAPDGPGTVTEVKDAVSHAIALCEGRTTGTPRRQKFETAERLEAMLELLDGSMATTASRLEDDGGANGADLQLMTLCQKVTLVHEGRATKSDVSLCLALAELLEGLLQPDVQLARVLRAGGEAAEEALTLALEHALDLTEGRISGTPRRTRAALADRLEAVLEATGKVVPKLSPVEADVLDALAEKLVAVGEIRPESATSSDVAAVAELLDTLEPYTLDSAQQPEPEPEPELAHALGRTSSTIPAGSDHPVYRALEAHQLETHFDKLLELGVKRVEDLEQITPAEMEALEMKRFDASKFRSAFLTETPHHGAAAAKGLAGEAMGSGFSFAGDKHAMISYQWDDQELVLKVREHFRLLGIPTWMDVDGGMRSNIYDSMAQGVSNAAVVVAFISQRYQDSENCTLELQYAKQRKVPIVPVMTQGNSWRPTEWLGVVLAGSLWSPMHDVTKLRENLQGVCEQIKAACPTVAVSTGDGTMSRHPAAAAAAVAATAAAAVESEEISSLRNELDSLRQSLAQAVTVTARRSSTAGRSSDTAVEESALAPVPAEVPALSLNCRPTSDMAKLKSMLLSTSSDDSTNLAVTSEKQKIGAMGMGGIGKTVTAAWLARNEDVRKHFERICWVTLGQEPDIDRCAQLIHLQVTGQDLPSDTSAEQVKERIAVAMRDKLVLLILDDVWAEEHSSALECVDPATASKTLVTTRIRNLGGAAQVELGMPSQEESIKLLLASAGLSNLSQVPAQAPEVVQLCGRLPLAIDMCGKMLRDLGVTGSDWSGIPKLLQQELHSTGGDETTVEYRVIAASLNAIPARDRDDAKQVLSVFALVAEDCHVPLRAFQILLSAVMGQTELVPDIQVRRWLQVLVNRSVVLGSWERPQLHDITRDYAISLHSPEELQQLQQRAVDAFVAHRPVSADPKMVGLQRWVPQRGDDCSLYVKNNIEHHIRGALDCNLPGPEPAAEAPPAACAEVWLTHYPGVEKDESIVQGVARVLGKERLLEIMDEALGEERLWPAVAAYGAWRSLHTEKGAMARFDRGEYTDVEARVWPAVKQIAMHDDCPKQLTTMQHQHYSLDKCLADAVWLGFFGAKDALRRKPYLTEADLTESFERAIHLVSNTEAGVASDNTASELEARMEIGQLFWAGKVQQAIELELKQFNHKFPVEKLCSMLDAGQMTAKQQLFYLGNISHSPCFFALDGWSWELVDRIDAVAAVQTYDFATDVLTDNNGGLFWIIAPALAPALRGDLGAANSVLDIYLQLVCCHLEHPLAHQTCIQIRLPKLMTSYLPLLLHNLGRSEEAATIMTSMGITWTTADECVDTFQAFDEPWTRKRGSTERTALGIKSVEHYSWINKLQVVLCSSASGDQAPQAAEVMDALPEPEVLDAYVTEVWSRPGPMERIGLQHELGSVMLLAAEVCEKLGRPAEGLLYIAKVLDADAQHPDTDSRATTQANGNTIRGRLLAAHGGETAHEEAEAAFEKAIEVSHRTGLRLFELFALRDFFSCILKPGGRGGEVVPRLKAVLKEMKGPHAELAKLLGSALVDELRGSDGGWIE